MLVLISLIKGQANIVLLPVLQSIVWMCLYVSPLMNHKTFFLHQCSAAQGSNGCIAHCLQTGGKGDLLNIDG